MFFYFCCARLVKIFPIFSCISTVRLLFMFMILLLLILGTHFTLAVLDISTSTAVPAGFGRPVPEGVPNTVCSA